MRPLLLSNLVYILKYCEQSRETKLILIHDSVFAHEFSSLASIYLEFWGGRKGGVKLTCILYSPWNCWASVILCCYCLRSCPDGRVTLPLFQHFLTVVCIFCLLFGWLCLGFFFLNSLQGERWKRIFGESFSAMF